ncbi:MAG: purine-nucleoside phosphorylase [Acidobacteria bacterium]|nr:purine-nucleoside phosphorylase [Acidobacteriota bacterium]
MRDDSSDYLRRLDEAAGAVLRRIPAPPRVGLILGSGLGESLKRFSGNLKISYAEIPYFHPSAVAGHSGNLIFGRIGALPFVALQGRIHYYEGYSLREVVFPLRVLARLGIGHLIVTNAAGGINREFEPGDLMLIADHINLMGANPLAGPNLDQLGPRFPDMSEAYCPRFRTLARSVAAGIDGMNLREGVYAAVAGPSYETPAEVRMLAALGADAVGMSTVPEVIAANHAGLRVLGISCITNMAAGISGQKLDHREVVDVAGRARAKFSALLGGVLDKVAHEV